MRMLSSLLWVLYLGCVSFIIRRVGAHTSNPRRGRAESLRPALITWCLVCHEKGENTTAAGERTTPLLFTPQSRVADRSGPHKDLGALFLLQPCVGLEDGL